MSEPLASESVERALSALGALLDHLIPRDQAPGGRDLVDASELRVRIAGLDRLLQQLGDFEKRSEREQDEMIRQLDSLRDPHFLELVDVVHDLYYSDARAWPAVGYTTHLPPRR
jgi:hypothetical protein